MSEEDFHLHSGVKMRLWEWGCCRDTAPRQRRPVHEPRGYGAPTQVRDWQQKHPQHQEAEIQRVVDFLVDVREGLREGDGDATLHVHFAGLHRVIQRLMDATFEAKERDLTVLLAGPEHGARLCKQEIERRLGVRN